MKIAPIIKKLATLGKTVWPGSDGAVNLEGGTYFDKNGNLIFGLGAGYAPDLGTPTASAGAETSNHQVVQITSESLTTAAAGTYTNTLTDSLISSTSVIKVNVANGTNTAAGPLGVKWTVSAGSVAIAIKNNHATAALNGTLIITVEVLS